MLIYCASVEVQKKMGDLMIKAIVTDFDGVLRHWQQGQMQALEQHCKLPDGALVKLCLASEQRSQALCGHCTYDQWVDEIYQSVQQQYGRVIASQVIEIFQSPNYVIDHDLIEQYRRLFPRTVLILATNATNRLPQELQDAGLQHSFDHVFNSSAMGVAKPEPGFFHGLLISCGLCPQEVVFIDDSQHNILAAQELGMTALHYTDRKLLLQAISHLTEALPIFA